MLQTTYINLSKLNWNDLKYYLPYFDKKDRIEILSLRNSHERKILLVKIMMANSILKKYIKKKNNLSEDEFMISHSYSHSNELVVGTVAFCKYLGIDLISSSNISNSTLKSLFNKNEITAIHQSNNQNVFCKLRARKHAFMKALDLNLKFDDMLKISVLEDEIIFKKKHFYFIDCKLDENYYLSIASAINFRKHTIKEVLLHDLIHF